MDEPTSSVDLATEKDILHNVMQAFQNSTIVISLHRLHLLPNFDRVIMLHDGQVIAQGHVADLINQPGPVYDLWRKYQE